MSAGGKAAEMLRRTVFVLAVALAGALASTLTGDSSSSPPAEAQSCSPAYPGQCIPPPPPDLDCGSPQVQFSRFPVQPPDPHRLDGNDNDSLGCEDSPKPPFVASTTTIATTSTTAGPQPTTTTTVVADTRIISITPAPTIASGFLERTG